MIKRSITCAALDDDDNGISVSQTPAAGPNEAMTITGALATAGVATMAAGQLISVTSAADDVGSILIVTGTDADGTAITETITLTAGPGVDTGAVYFKTVSSIVIDVDTVGALEVGVLAASGGVSPTMSVEIGGRGREWDPSLFTDIGAGTYTVRMTAEEKDDTHSNGYSNSANWVAITAFSAKTADVASLLDISCHGLQVNVTTFTSGAFVATLLERSPEG